MVAAGAATPSAPRGSNASRRSVGCGRTPIASVRGSAAERAPKRCEGMADPGWLDRTPQPGPVPSWVAVPVATVPGSVRSAEVGAVGAVTLRLTRSASRAMSAGTCAVESRGIRRTLPSSPRQATGNARARYRSARACVRASVNGATSHQAKRPALPGTWSTAASLATSAPALAARSQSRRRCDSPKSISSPLPLLLQHGRADVSACVACHPLPRLWRGTHRGWKRKFLGFMSL